mgnify:CR=1 FL=1
MFRNSIALENDPDQVNLIKMRIKRIWDCPDKDQEVRAKHINETEMFQITSRETIKPIDEEVGDLVELEDVSKFEHTINSIERIDEANEDNPDRRGTPKETALPD